MFGKKHSLEWQTLILHQGEIEDIAGNKRHDEEDEGMGGFYFVNLENCAEGKNMRKISNIRIDEVRGDIKVYSFCGGLFGSTYI